MYIHMHIYILTHVIRYIDICKYSHMPLQMHTGMPALLFIRMYYALLCVYVYV